MIVIGGFARDAVVTGDRVAVRGMGVVTNLTQIFVDGISRKVIRSAPSLYIPGVVILTLEPLNV